MELHFSETIKQLRKSRGLTQEQLAEALGVTTGAVYKWENSLAMPEIRMIAALQIQSAVPHLRLAPTQSEN